MFLKYHNNNNNNNNNNNDNNRDFLKAVMIKINAEKRRLEVILTLFLDHSMASVFFSIYILWFCLLLYLKNEFSSCACEVLNS